MEELLTMRTLWIELIQQAQTKLLITQIHNIKQAQAHIPAQMRVHPATQHDGRLKAIKHSIQLPTLHVDRDYFPKELQAKAAILLGVVYADPSVASPGSIAMTVLGFSILSQNAGQSANASEQETIVQMLVNELSSEQINKDYFGDKSNAVHLAAFLGMKSTLDLLISKGGDLGLQNGCGLNAYDILEAVKLDDRELVELLRQQPGVDSLKKRLGKDAESFRNHIPSITLARPHHLNRPEKDDNIGLKDRSLSNELVGSRISLLNPNDTAEQYYNLLSNNINDEVFNDRRAISEANKTLAFTSQYPIDQQGLLKLSEVQDDDDFDYLNAIDPEAVEPYQDLTCYQRIIVRRPLMDAPKPIRSVLKNRNDRQQGPEPVLEAQIAAYKAYDDYIAKLQIQTHCHTPQVNSNTKEALKNQTDSGFDDGRVLALKKSKAVQWESVKNVRIFQRHMVPEAGSEIEDENEDVDSIILDQYEQVIDYEEPPSSLTNRFSGTLGSPPIDSSLDGTMSGCFRHLTIASNLNAGSMDKPLPFPKYIPPLPLTRATDQEAKDLSITHANPNRSLPPLPSSLDIKNSLNRELVPVPTSPLDKLKSSLIASSMGGLQSTPMIVVGRSSPIKRIPSPPILESQSWMTRLLRNRNHMLDSTFNSNGSITKRIRQKLQPGCRSKATTQSQLEADKATMVNIAKLAPSFSKDPKPPIPPSFFYECALPASGLPDATAATQTPRLSDPRLKTLIEGEPIMNNITSIKDNVANLAARPPLPPRPTLRSSHLILDISTPVLAPSAKVTANNFTFPGPKPFTKQLKPPMLARSHSVGRPAHKAGDDVEDSEGNKNRLSLSAVSGESSVTLLPIPKAVSKQSSQWRRRKEVVLVVSSQGLSPTLMLSNTAKDAVNTLPGKATEIGSKEILSGPAQGQLEPSQADCSEAQDPKKQLLIGDIYESTPHLGLEARKAVSLEEEAERVHERAHTSPSALLYQHTRGSSGDDAQRSSDQLPFMESTLAAVHGTFDERKEQSFTVRQPKVVQDLGTHESRIPEAGATHPSSGPTPTRPSSSSVWTYASNLEPERMTLSSCTSPSATNTGILYLRIKRIEDIVLEAPDEDTMLSVRIDTGREKIDTDYMPWKSDSILFNQEFCLPVYEGLNITLTTHLMQAPHLQPRFTPFAVEPSTGPQCPPVLPCFHGAMGSSQPSLDTDISPKTTVLTGKGKAPYYNSLLKRHLRERVSGSSSSNSSTSDLSDLQYLSASDTMSAASPSCGSVSSLQLDIQSPSTWSAASTPIHTSPSTPIHTSPSPSAPASISISITSSGGRGKERAEENRSILGRWKRGIMSIPNSLKHPQDYLGQYRHHRKRLFQQTSPMMVISEIECVRPLHPQLGNNQGCVVRDPPLGSSPPLPPLPLSSPPLPPLPRESDPANCRELTIKELYAQETPLQILSRYIYFEDELCISRSSIDFNMIRSSCRNQIISVEFQTVNDWVDLTDYDSYPSSLPDDYTATYLNVENCNNKDKNNGNAAEGGDSGIIAKILASVCFIPGPEMDPEDAIYEDEDHIPTEPQNLVECQMGLRYFEWCNRLLFQGRLHYRTEQGCWRDGWFQIIGPRLWQCRDPLLPLHSSQSSTLPQDPTLPQPMSKIDRIRCLNLNDMCSIVTNSGVVKVNTGKKDQLPWGRKRPVNEQSSLNANLVDDCNEEGYSQAEDDDNEDCGEGDGSIDSEQDSIDKHCFCLQMLAKGSGEKYRDAVAHAAASNTKKRLVRLDFRTDSEDMAEAWVEALLSNSLERPLRPYWLGEYEQ
ncbi:hypothetical protein BX616_011358 [Lobosporangium transversale]|nr:hypothetical protein BX616_011358 [Lobosporangium transversale]